MRKQVSSIFPALSHSAGMLCLRAVSEKSARMFYGPMAPTLLVMVLSVFASACNKQPQAGPGGSPGAPGGGRGNFSNAPVPVVAGAVETRDVPIYLEGLGTAQAFNTVTVRTRVDGQVEKIAFNEGQEVRAGDLLAQIDPAPFKAALDQSTAKKAQDEAQLRVAQITLERDKKLLESKILAQQDYDTQEALVTQLQAGVQADQAAIDNARVQLAYTSITSPLDGRTGIRQVDVGNIARSADSNAIVVITQVKPISLIFTLPEQTLPQIREHAPTGQGLTVLALDRDNHTILGEGKLAVIDNQIDTSTGTIRIKATFPNEDLKLWPGQFLNARLILETRKGATVVPASVVQRGPDGAFAYVVEGNKAEVRPLQVAQIQEGIALIDHGLTPGEQVVVDGQYKLRPGALVQTGTNPPGRMEGPVEKGKARPGTKTAAAS
jgi:membrane fusion protein, multidrug efflux system